MTNKLGWVLAAILLPGPAFALGLGKLVLDSGLNEPLEARIELLSPTRAELDSLAVGLADSEAFERAGVERLFILSGIKFELQESESGTDFIRVYSRDAIREPFLNFLVEINWSKGRLVREYTVLLDPPLYDPGIRAPVVRTPGPAPLPVETDADADAMPATAADSAAVAMAWSGGDYGPTVQNDTLWSIASRMRPDESVSIQQMMLALYRTNPEAFINNNINGLRKGQILRMPSAQEIAALSREQALAEVQSQHAAWDPGRAAEAVAPAPQVAPAAPAAPAPAAAPAAPVDSGAREAELRLVAPGTSGTGAGAGTGAAAGKGLELANEQLSALTQENIDLKSRLTEAETIIEDLKRLIALKDDELAALQSKMGAQPGEAPAAAPGPAAEPAPVPAEETPAPAPEAKTEPAAKPEAKPEAAPEKAATPEQKPAPAKAPAPAAAEKAAPKGDGGIVDTLVSMLKANLVIIGAVLGAILAVVGGLAFMAHRKRTEAVEAEDEAASAAVQFPDFAGSEEETILPGAAAEEEPEVEERGAGKEPESAAAAVAVAPAAKAPAAKTPAPPAPVAEAPQEDPLAEVNVFLAYEHFDQAEEFVREAIKREPDNLEFHSKLLEVFYAANDRRKYEEAARVLHDKVGGAGPHWDMALAMWQEISPGRALFSEPSGEEEAAAPTGVGRIDLTAKEKAADADDGGLDFDLGEMTAGGPDAAADSGEDMLDVTAAVGLDTADEALPEPAAEGGDVLDLTGGQGGEEAMPDLDVPAGEDLLDVTAHSDLEGTALDGDPLDVTVAAPADTVEDVAAAAQDAGKALDFDLNLDAPAPAAEEGNLLDFEPGLDKAGEGGVELDLTAGLETSAGGDDAGLELDAGTESQGEDMGLSLDTAGDAGESGEISLDDLGAGDSGELSLDDLGAGDSGELSLDDTGTGGSGELSLDDLGAGDSGGLSLEDAGTGEGGLELVLDEDDGGDQTVFVPRSDGGQEQSAEDEIATKLDLAKAYVELGDQDSARGILDEIGSAGSPDQQRQAQELRQQIS